MTVGARTPNGQWQQYDSRKGSAHMFRRKNNLPINEPLTQGWLFFPFLSDMIATINAPNEIISNKASATIIGSTSLHEGLDCAPTTLEQSFLNKWRIKKCQKQLNYSEMIKSRKSTSRYMTKHWHSYQSPMKRNI